MTIFEKKKYKGISQRRVNYIMSGLVILISALLLYTTFKVMGGYEEMRETTEDYIELQKEAYELQLGSDKLTEQVQLFVSTGKLRYLQGYFSEVESSRRQEVVRFFEEKLPDSNVLAKLKYALSESEKLQEDEIRAMWLTTLWAKTEFKYTDADIPQVVLDEMYDDRTSEGLLKESKEKLQDLAAKAVLSDLYHRAKNKIADAVMEARKMLENDTHYSEKETSEKLSGLLMLQQALIIALIIMMAVIAFVMSFQVISPLLKAVPRIRDDKPLPVKGASEYRFLASVYNQMYRINQERKQQLAYEATHDKLTGLYNRAGYEQLSETVNKDEFAMLIIDIDRFKTINDTYGHDVGDDVLVNVAETISSKFRSEDKICRVGGDEFVVFMINADKDAKEKIIEKIDAINEKLSQDGALPKTAVSAGVAFGKPEADVEKLFKKADNALYEAKDSGRRRCCFAK